MRIFLLVSLLSASLVLSAPVDDFNSAASDVELFNVEPANQDDSEVEEPNKVIHDLVVPAEDEADAVNRSNGDGESDAIDEQTGSFPQMGGQPQNDKEHESNHGSDAVQEHSGSRPPHLEGHETLHGDNEQQVQNDYVQDQQQYQEQDPNRRPSQSSRPQQGEEEQHPSQKEHSVPVGHEQNHRVPHGHTEERPPQSDDQEQSQDGQEHRAPQGQREHRPSQNGEQNQHAAQTHPSQRGDDRKYPHRENQRSSIGRQHQDASVENGQRLPRESHEGISSHGEQDQDAPHGQISEEERSPHGDEKERSSHEADSYEDGQQQRDDELPEQEESREEPELGIIAPKLINVNLNIYQN